MKQKTFAPAAGDLASHMRLWITTGLGLVADLFSKWLAWRMLENAPNQNHDIIEGFFAFKLARNPGIAFGIEIGWWPILIACVAPAWNAPNMISGPCRPYVFRSHLI